MSGRTHKNELLSLAGKAFCLKQNTADLALVKKSAPGASCASTACCRETRLRQEGACLLPTYCAYTAKTSVRRTKRTRRVGLLSVQSFTFHFEKHKTSSNAANESIPRTGSLSLYPDSQHHGGSVRSGRKYPPAAY